jgi:hypothetical protein
MPEPLQIKDLGITKLRAKLAELAASRLTFGYQGPSGGQQHPGAKKVGTTVAAVARWNEFGTATAPARPMGRHTMEENRDAFRAATRKAISDVIDGRAEADAAVEAVGEVAVAALRRSISRSREWAEANAASTIRKKGHDQPLVGEHQTLTTHASWAVRDKATGSIRRQGGEE